MHQHSLKLFFIFLVLLGLPACSVYRIDSQDTTSDSYPPKASYHEVVYLEKIDKPYEITGEVTVSVENSRGFSDVLLQMRDQAALLGGDAITAVSSGREGSLRTRYTAKVAVFK